MKTSYILPLALLFLLASCQDDSVSPGERGSLIIEFDNRIGTEDLVLNSDYTNPHGETFRLTRLNYYISNVKLTRTDGTQFVVPQDSSYFLIMEDSPSTQKARINNIPAGDYNAITFTIGVDSLRSTMDISKRTGVLDPAQGHDGMYWTWNSGYIFFKMEGVSSAAPDDQDNKFYYHIGGFGGYDSPTLNNLRDVVIQMGNARAEVRNSKQPQVHLHVDVQEFFSNPENIRISEHSNVMFSEYSRTISGNYVNMFKYDHVHN